MPKSVLIVDDHESIRRELRRLFESVPEFAVCGEAEDGADAIEMPEMSGLEAAGTLP